jgi:hypothetical protein
MMSKKPLKTESEKPLEIEWEIEVKDKNGKLLENKKGPSKSLLANFLRMLYGLFAGVTGSGYISILDTSGTGRSYPTCYGTSWPIARVVASANDANHGILVGSGDAAVDPDQYALASKIANGTGSGQLVYNAVTHESPVVSGMDTTYRITRTFTNNSGSSITIKEIGIAIADGISGILYYFLIVRDVLPSPSNVPDGATFTCRYTLKVTA